MLETARLDKLEDAIRKTQDSMLLMSKDVHQMNQSISSMANSIELLAKVQQDVRVMEERNESRHLQLKEADKLIHTRIDALHTQKSIIEVRANNGDRAYTIMVQIAKWVGASVATVIVGLIIFLIQLKG
ncbi:MAG: hypothetical protein WCX83_00210 [Candidatus Cloacimonas sp.]